MTAPTRPRHWEGCDSTEIRDGAYCGLCGVAMHYGQTFDALELPGTNSAPATVVAAPERDQEVDPDGD